MIAAVLLLCAVRALCSNDVCVSSHEAACFRPADYLNYLNASDPVSKELTVGEKLIISLEDLSESLVCYWMRGGDRLMTTEGNQLMVTPPLSETDSGEYTLTCQSRNDTLFSVTVILHVVMKRPTKPQLMLDGVDRPKTSPLFKCISEGSPHPTIEWNLGNYGGANKTSNGRTESTITSSDFDKTGMMCCATNAEGQECSQMYDYDLERNLMNKDEVSNVTLGKGQSLLLRCRMTWKSPPSPVWEKGGEVLDASILSCKPEKEEMCIKNDRHQGSRMAYLSIRSLREEHSGTYTCKGPNKNQTSVYVHVLVKGFLSAQLDEHKIIPAQLASSTCLQASVSYNPVLQHCSWETPDKNMIRCVRETGVTQHRTVKLCDGLISGDYKLHLEAGGQKETKNISVCVVGKPKFKFSVNEANDTYTVETESLVPANYTWLDCSEFNESCETDSSWKEIPNAFQTDSDVSCNKIIQSSLSTGLVDGDRLKFCLTNTVDSWCEIHHIIYRPSLFQSTIDLESNLMNTDEVSSVTLSKGQSLLLRCRMTWKSPSSPVWEKGGEVLDANTSSCKPEKEEMCIKNGSHYSSRIAYLSIRSVREEHSGTYTCKGPNKNPKSVFVHVSGGPPTYKSLMLLKVGSLILLLAWL
ncbi:receptor-type tyrosine-protein kinase FLT3-like [Archocentrus centrarchus]|uniref:receptor-type tyrosine-protein kinase FLT3-like n=1 Tax=Archocentrus centrarchus TaxID=63155 RepID=UPI0011E9C253|nr:receptor-type tyrosine-protein kinase FLT3-like [Archocentrus centrarchus]